MTETIEIRIPELHAAKYLPAGTGVCVGGVARKLELSSDDPLLNEIGAIDASFRRQDRAFFTGWITHRKYKKSELQSSELVHLRIQEVLETAGEEHGTQYDDSDACSVCGGGSKQASALCLDTTQIATKSDIVRTLAGEIVVSARFRDACIAGNLDGVEFREIFRAENQNTESKEWYQLFVGGRVSLSALTKVGNDPFENSIPKTCECGRTLGLNLLSEVAINDGYTIDADAFTTAELIGVRRGLLRPTHLVLISQKFFDVLAKSRIKGVAYEVSRVT